MYLSTMTNKDNRPTWSFYLNYDHGNDCHVQYQISDERLAEVLADTHCMVEVRREAANNAPYWDVWFQEVAPDLPLPIDDKGRATCEGYVVPKWMVKKLNRALAIVKQQ